MPKVTLDLNAFKALASETRLDILKTLDGKKMSLKDVSNATNLNKATLYEHLSKLTEAGLVKKKEREGYKWVYYKLSWKGENLLHPENTRIVVLFSATFISLFFGIVGLINFAREKIAAAQYPDVVFSEGTGSIMGPGQDPTLLYLTIGCLILFIIFMAVSIWRYKKNKIPKL